MNYKPEESTLMAYLYGELEGLEKEKFEKYLLLHPEVSIQLDHLRELRKMMESVKDKEVIAPPIFVGDHKRNMFWSSPYLKTIVGIAASLLLVILVGKLVDVRVKYFNGELTLGFGNPVEVKPKTMLPQTPALTVNEVQEMINSALLHNNTTVEESQQELRASIQKNLVVNSNKIDQLIQKTSTASQEQIQNFVATLQSDNMKLMKDYFQLTSADQKKYIEDLLVDFAKYMQQQRNNDMQVVQAQLNSLEKDTDTFKQETEQILSSIITIGGSAKSKGIKN